MTHIKSIKLHGFKSFANHTEMMFGDGFNVILGPNGSGKSNVGDAICFVLGKSSTKSLRAEKGSGLIYNGGKHKDPAKRAQVDIVFDNKSKVFSTDGEEVKVSRIVKQSGQSVYKINDKTRTRQEILDLLGLARVDPDGHNIVLQGDVMKFVDLSPMQKRVLIEEVSDIAVYEEKKNKALKELEKTDNKLKEADIILTERKTYLRELKKDRDQALKYKEMTNAVEQNKASYLYLKIEKREKNKKELEQRAGKNGEVISKKQQDVEKLKQDNLERKKVIDTITSEVEQKGETDQTNLRKEIEQLKVNIASSKTRVNSCKNEIDKIDQRKAQLRLSYSEIDERFNDLEAEKARLIKDKKAKEKEKAALEQKLAKFKKDNNLEATISIEKEIDAIDKKLEEKQKSSTELVEQQQNLLREKDRVEYELNNLDARIEKVKTIEAEHKSQLLELKNKRTLSKTIASDLNRYLDEDSSLASQIVKNRQDLVKLNEKLAKIRARSMAAQETLVATTAANSVIKLKKTIKGIHGTLSQLGDVADKYAVALSTAAGSRMNSVVVDSDEVASKCIKYLKQNRLGTVTFIPLNKIKARETDSSVRTLSKKTGSHGLALDLISFDPKFKKAFGYVFSNTIVVSNIETARKLGIGKAKFVTLDGDSAELSGVMHGGFRKSRPTGFSERNLKKDLVDTENAAAELTHLISTLEKRKTSNEEEVSSLRIKKSELEGEIIKIEKSLHLDEGDISATKDSKGELSKKLTKLDEEFGAIREKLTEQNKELAELKMKKQDLRTQLSQLRDPSLLAELNNFEQTRQNLNESMIKIDAEVKNLQIQMDNMLGSEKEKTETIIKQNEKDKTEFNEEIKKLNTKISQDNKKLAEKEKLAAKFYAKFKEAYAKRAEQGVKIQKNEVKIDALNDEVRQLENKNNIVSLELAKVNAELAGLNQEFEQYQGVKIIKSRSEDDLKREIKKFERLKESMGSVNMKALEIYESVVKEYDSLMEKKAKIDSEKESILKMMDEIEGKKKGLFMETFNAVNENFQRIFGTLTTKGGAFLELENPDNPFEGGMNLKVRLTSKKYMDIRSLSGGEKTLTTLAFLFAIQEYQPASFYILDEVDAALDKHNSEKFANLISSYSGTAQYLLITHNDSVISEADYLYGVSMGDHGVSKITSLKI